jgi:hypothetical protein
MQLQIFLNICEFSLLAIIFDSILRLKESVSKYTK